MRDLAERDVLQRTTAARTSAAETAEVQCASHPAGHHCRAHRPPRPGAKKTFNAAAVIGSRFNPDLLTSLGIDPVLDALVKAELIDQVRVHPAGRVWLPSSADPHGGLRIAAEIRSCRVAPACGRRDRQSVTQQSFDENAALIAEHLEAAGELHAAYCWHMRAGTGRTNRDIAAARVSWERARQRRRRGCPTTSRIASRCGSRRAPCCVATPGESMPTSPARFEELRQLCAHAGDKAVAGHRHGRADDGAHAAMAVCARHRGWHPNNDTARVDRRPPTRTFGRWSVTAYHRSSMKPARWPTCCGGRKPLSIWPTVPPKATASSDHHWRWCW